MMMRDMPKLTHYRICPLSRSIRLALVELGQEFDLAEERPWEFRPEFLAINPAGELPVLQFESGQAVCGATTIAEYLAEAPPPDPEDDPVIQLLPGSREERAEVRRLVDWFHGKLNREVSRDLLQEKVYGSLNSASAHAPDTGILRAVRANLRYHLSYVNHLADERRWLAGEEMSFADLAAAAHFSAIDYLGEVPWDDFVIAKSWYARLKSRPSFRTLLADRVPGAPPSNTYADLDF
jgi:glutathione S-transferase